MEPPASAGVGNCRHPPFSWLSRLNECARLLYKALSARRANSFAPVQANIIRNRYTVLRSRGELSTSPEALPSGEGKPPASAGGC